MQRRSFAYTLALFSLLMVVGFSAIHAQQNAYSDNRINQGAHFGGDAFYCVDEERNPVDQFYEDDTTATGFRLLDKNGQELWYVAPEIVKAALSDARPGTPEVLIATGSGSYGETALYVIVRVDGQRFFTFTGYDEHGKTNSLIFQDCNPDRSVVLTGISPSTLTPTNTPSPTVTQTSSTPTNTPTNTPAAPTSTLTNTPTNTPVAPTSTPTNTPTNTPVAPTSTPTNTPTPGPTPV